MVGHQLGGKSLRSKLASDQFLGWISRWILLSIAVHHFPDRIASSAPALSEETAYPRSAFVSTVGVFGCKRSCIKEENREGHAIHFNFSDSSD
jgi:hypothetical protein